MCQRKDSLVTHGEDHHEAVCPPPACGNDHAKVDIHTAARRGPHITAGGYILKEAATCGEPMQEQVFWQNLWPLRGPCWSSLFQKDCSPCEGPMLEQGKSMRNGRQQLLCTDRSPPFPILLVLLWGVISIRNEGMKLSLGRRGVREGVLSFVFSPV